MREDSAMNILSETLMKALSGFQKQCLIPVYAGATNRLSVVAMSCDDTCSGSCYGDCRGGCSGSCSGSCEDGCRSNCEDLSY